MKRLILIEKENTWEEAIKTASQNIKDDETVILVWKEGVKRCIRCEPELFKILHQFILDGGKAYVCLKSLKKFDIPETRPPEAFERIEDGEDLIKDLKNKGFEIVKF